jgi:hypothetical protein
MLLLHRSTPDELVALGLDRHLSRVGVGAENVAATWRSARTGANWVVGTPRPNRKANA